MAADDPAQFGFIVLVLMMVVPAGLVTLVLGIGDARKKGRTQDPPVAGEPNAVD